MATRSDAEANVSFYGVGLDDLIGEAGNITRPYLAHVAAKDGFVPPEAQAKFVPVLEKHPKASVHVYQDQDHAFARVGGKHYDRRSEEHTSELQSLMRISYAVFCLKKKTIDNNTK